ncbi:MAG: hypothetical protein ACJ77K_05705 [Bacteroidia bacterium]|jgi:hypothetical protein
MNPQAHILLKKKAVTLLIVFVLLYPVTSFSQTPIFTIKLKFSIEGGSLDNSLITITKSGQTYRTIDPSKGKYNIDLELGGDYLMTFTKTGYITKQVMVNTAVPNGREDDDFAKFIAEVSLEKQPEDQVITYSQPVGRIKYIPADNDFGFDNDYTQTAVAAQKKDKENAKPKPKEPAPNPKPEAPKPVQAELPPSKPEPVVVKQPENKPEPVKPKPIIVETAPERPAVVKDKEEKIIQKDRLKITLVTVKIDGVAYEYKKEEYAWGGVYYYRDGKNITEPTFEKETQ